MRNLLHREPSISRTLMEIRRWNFSTNASNINFSLSSYLHNLISLQPPRNTGTPDAHLLSLFLTRQPSPWKSQIAHLDMHYLVFGINFQIHSLSLSSLISIHLLINLTTRLCRHPRSHHPSLLHTFTPGSKPPFSTNPSYLMTSFTYCTASG